MNSAEKLLSKKLAYEFSDPRLLQQALTHRSVGARNNERLEFLGDGALNFIIASEIYRLKPEYREGQLSRLRANLVRGVTLAEVAREIGLGDYLKLGSGELKSGGFNRDSILADALEAILGAVYIDSDFDTLQRVVCHLFASRLSNLPGDEPQKDPKTRLQEYLQARRLPLPVYELVETRGQDHQRTFFVQAAIEDLALQITAQGTSRRRAEQAAAEQALTTLESKNQ
ncbi:MAG: ribonuclease III [Pseudomonadota bacterium]